MVMFHFQANKIQSYGGKKDKKFSKTFSFGCKDIKIVKKRQSVGTFYDHPHDGIVLFQQMSAFQKDSSEWNKMKIFNFLKKVQSN